jgi:hypothetical protein
MLYSCDECGHRPTPVRARVPRSSKVPFGTGTMALSNLEDQSNVDGSVPVYALANEGGARPASEVRARWRDSARTEGRFAMTRRERVAPTPFGQFMASTAGRVFRGAIGIALIVAGLLVAGVTGWVLGAFGAVLLAAGLFDFCVITGLVDNIWSGREVRARGRRGAPRTA